MNDLGLIVVEAAARATALAVVGLILASWLGRRGASAGALASSTTLAVLVVVSALAASPWPRWWSTGEIAAARPALAAAPSTPNLRAPAEPRPSLPPGPAAEAGGAPPVAWSDFVDEFRRELARPAVDGRPTGWRWPAWAAVVFLAGLVVAMARLGLGVGAVRTLRDRSRAVDDPAMLGLVAALRAEMGLRRGVEVRESVEISTPATVGWRRPALLLPVGWADWDDLERRAVLAHELAHVLRADYLAGLAAQVSLSLHFYHPLVHALAGRLRLQQELAADAWGARLSGGRRPYLTALANLALRQDPRPAAWPARPFLPTRGTFLRRIEMLRDPRALQQSPLPGPARAVTVATLALAGLMVAGFRGPASTPRAMAQDAPAAKAASPSTPLDPSSASSDAHLVVEIRPADLLKNPDLRKIAELFPADGPQLPRMVASGEIEQAIVFGFERRDGGPPHVGLPAQLALVLRSARPTDWKAFMAPKAVEVKADGFSYFREEDHPASTCFRVLDDRTFVVGREADVKVPPIGGDRPRGRHAWDDAWKKLGPGAIRVAFDTPWLVRQIQPPGQPDRPGAFSPITSIFGPLFNQTQAYALTLGVADALTLDALATCGTEEGAGRVVDTVRASMTLARNALADARRMAEAGPPDAARPMSDVIDALGAMIDASRIEQDKATAKLHARADAPVIATYVRTLLPAVGAARESARRTRCTNNLKQIGLAMHNYHSVNNCFPPAVLYGPDGKTPYSWRVALLPYLEQNPLYSQYKFDEPWDGPNNSKILAAMPMIYACADDDQAVPGHHTSYFVLTGPDTLFPDRKEGMGLQEVTDGTSNTILVVESKRMVPWTRPEDIPYARDKPLPVLGKLHPAGFNAAFADGGVRFIKDSIDQGTLRALFSRAGGERINADQR